VPLAERSFIHRVVGLFFVPWLSVQSKVRSPQMAGSAAWAYPAGELAQATSVRCMAG
jgi:hypothetical protein